MTTRTSGGGTGCNHQTNYIPCDRRYTHPVRMLAHRLSAIAFALLITAAMVSRGPGSIPDGDHTHGHVHHHDRLAHLHGHSHFDHRDLLGDSGSRSCFGESAHAEADHHCCCDHHHWQPVDGVLPSRHSDSVPTAAVVALLEDAWFRSGSHAHQDSWPPLRGRPPDYLIHLRTVVLLT